MEDRARDYGQVHVQAMLRAGEGKELPNQHMHLAAYEVAEYSNSRETGTANGLAIACVMTVVVVILAALTLLPPTAYAY